MPKEIANSIFDGSYGTVNNNKEQDKEDYDIWQNIIINILYLIIIYGDQSQTS